jgi:hypothetical protein
MNNDDMFPKHEGGSGRLRALLRGLDEDHEKQMMENPLYREGFDDGYHKALVDALGEKQNMKELIRMLIKLYDDDDTTI